jgi:hypothetical protein
MKLHKEKLESIEYFCYGATAILAGFLAPPLAIPCFGASFALFAISQIKSDYEHKFTRPKQARFYAAWEQVLDHAAEHETGAAQAFQVNQVDWKYRQKNTRQNLRGSIGARYLELFTVGEQQQQQAPMATPAPTIQTVDVQAVASGSKPSKPSKPTSQAEPESRRTESAPLLDLSKLIHSPFVFIYGAQGSGKTALAKTLARARQAKGHEITVADPHGSKLEWGNWELVGAGRSFSALNELLRDFDEAVTADYIEYADGRRDYPKTTLLIDEFTQWADKCKASAAFIKSVCSDIRKIGKCALIVSHSRTLTGIGGADGLRKSIDSSAIMIELEAIEDREGNPIPSGFGWLEFPGKERVRVSIPFEAEPAPTPAPTPARSGPEAIEVEAVEVEPEPTPKKPEQSFAERFPGRNNPVGEVQA